MVLDLKKFNKEEDYDRVIKFLRDNYKENKNIKVNKDNKENNAASTEALPAPTENEAK